MVHLYFVAGMLGRILFVLFLAFCLCRWAEFIHCRLKFIIRRRKQLQGNNFSFFPLRAVSSLFEFPLFERRDERALKLLKTGSFFLGALVIFFFLPFGRATVTLHELHSPLADFNLFHLAETESGLLYLLFLILPLGIAGFNLSRQTDNKLRIGTRRYNDLFFPAVIAAALIIMAAAASANTLSVKRLVNFQAENGWLFYYQLPGLLTWILLNQFFFYRFFYSESSGLDSAYKGDLSGIPRLLQEGGEVLYTVGISSLTVVIFFGGGRAPFPAWEGWELLSSLTGMAYIWEFLWFFCKITVLLIIFFLLQLVSIRLTHRQARSILWKIGVPLALLNLLNTGLITRFYGPATVRLIFSSALIFILSLLVINFCYFKKYSQNTVSLKKNKNSASKAEDQR